MNQTDHKTYEADQAEKLSRFFKQNYPFDTWGGTENFGNFELTVDDDFLDIDFFEELGEIGIGLDLSGARNYSSYGLKCPLEDLGAFFNEDKLKLAFEHMFYWLPIYMYQHSGATVNTTGFNCRWDSGLVGIAFIQKSDFLKGGYFGVKAGWSADNRQAWAEVLLRSWVKTLDDVLQNNIFRWSVVDRRTGENIESCGGYLGDEGVTAAITEGKDTIKYLRKQELLGRVNKLRNMIKNKVPLNKRSELLAKSE